MDMGKSHEGKGGWGKEREGGREAVSRMNETCPLASSIVDVASASVCGSRLYDTAHSVRLYHRSLVIYRPVPLETLR